MYIIMIASECAPAAKVGGLADVVYGLSKNLEMRGNTVEIILPKYDCLRNDLIENPTLCHKNLNVPWNNGSIVCSVWRGTINSRTCFFVDPRSPENFFARGAIYGCRDDGMRFAFFCKAALEFLFKSGKRPDIIHCHDWHSGLTPVLFKEFYKSQGMEKTRICLTVHNFRHQGIMGAELLRATGLNRPEYFFRKDKMADIANPGVLNFLKSAIVYSDYVVAVSPRYAWEAMHTDQGCGLNRLLLDNQQKFCGILNGIDYDVWNPETDCLIPFRYNAGIINDKYRNKDALREKLWLKNDFKPVIAVIGRLDMQKGIHLIKHALSYAPLHGAQFVLLGTSPDQALMRDFKALQKQYANHPDCRIELSFNEELAHLIYAGADMILVPSMFEPCGLTQIIALKYGTVPVVRETGGLVNTVFDRDYSDKPKELRNGYSFRDSDTCAIESALYRALDLWYNNPHEFQTLMLNGMCYDFSWNISGGKYQEIYTRLTAEERNVTV
ncbi:MAG TPA: starch synthase [Fibrobacteres bacterium]|nr:starch synthase [Fibrobacterota bacterium]